MSKTTVKPENGSESEIPLVLNAKKGRRKRKNLKVNEECKPKSKTKKISIIKTKNAVPSNQLRIDSFFKSCSKISNGDEHKPHEKLIVSSIAPQPESLTVELKGNIRVKKRETLIKSSPVVALRRSQRNHTTQKIIENGKGVENEKGAENIDNMTGTQRKRKIDEDDDDVLVLETNSKVECINLCSDDEDSSTTITLNHKTLDENNNHNERAISKRLSDHVVACNKTNSSVACSAERSVANNNKTSNGRGRRKPCPLPTYKCVEGTNFAVDAFKYGRIEGVTFYFLTHFHADHYVGLTGKFDMPIYLSEITASLVRTFIPVPEKYLHIIPLDTPIVIDDVQITAIDANHCPGSVMFLFKLSTGRCILHTGDFRACPEMESHPAFWNDDIHTIYLDTTYISNKYNFCTQSESIEQAKAIMTKFISEHKNQRVLFVCGSYLIGKEKFWSALAQEFQLRVWAEGNRRKAIDVMKLQALENRICDNPLEADMHIIPIVKVNYMGLCDYFQPPLSEAFDVLLAFRPSGWEKNSQPRLGRKINIVGIEYSEHSSHNEIKRFVSYLKPKEVISTVPTGGGRDACATGQIPASWYTYKKLRPNGSCQTTISSYMTIKPSMAATKNNCATGASNSFVNVSPLKAKTSDTGIYSAVGNEYVCLSICESADDEEVGTERIDAKHSLPQRNSSNARNVFTSAKRDALSSARKSLTFDCGGDDADSDWLS